MQNEVQNGATALMSPPKKRTDWRMASDIGERIKDLRFVLGGLSQPQLGKLIGRSWKAVSDWERGTRPPPADLLEWVCRSRRWPLEMFQQDGPLPSEALQSGMDRAVATPVTSGEEVSRMVSHAVAAAIRKMIVQNEMEHTRVGRHELVEILQNLAVDIELRRGDASDIRHAIKLVQDGL